MDVREKLVELLTDNLPRIGNFPKCDNPLQYTIDEIVERIADHLIANGVTVQDVSDTNVGEWISVKDRLPELTEGTEAYKQSPCCLVTLQWWDGEMSESIGWYNQSGEWNEDSKNCKVIAWQPLPKAYQPKGE